MRAGRRQSRPALEVGTSGRVLRYALDRAALARLRCEKRLEIVPRASHLLERPGALDAVIGLAREWFVTHLREEAAA